MQIHTYSREIEIPDATSVLGAQSWTITNYTLFKYVYFTPVTIKEPSCFMIFWGRFE